MNNTANILMLTGDLLFKTKISTASARLNKTCVALTSQDDLHAAQFTGRKLLIVDLEFAGLNLEKFHQLKTVFSNKLHVVGYAPHIDSDLIQPARKSGFDLVLSRSKFVRILPELLVQF